MSGLPYVKFYPADWQADEGVGLLSLAARGLWLEMLWIMHKAEGHLRINGRPVTSAILARAVRCDLAECEALLAELEEAGVYSRDDEGLIYSRRMVRDIERAKLADPTAADRMRRYRRRQKGNDPGPNGDGRYGNRNENVTGSYTHSARVKEDSLLTERESDVLGISVGKDGNSRTDDGAARRAAISDVERALATKPAQRERIVARLHDPKVIYPEQFAKKCIRNAMTKRGANTRPKAQPPPPSVWVCVGTPAWTAWDRVDPLPALQSNHFREPGRMRPTEFPEQERQA